MLLFLVALNPRSRTMEVISQETVEETGAVVMTRDEASKMGFSGLPDAQPGVEMRVVACRESSARRIQHALGINEDVLGFEAVQVDD